MPSKHAFVLLLAASAACLLGAPAALGASGGGGAAAPLGPEVRKAACLNSPGVPCSGRGLLRGRTFVVRGAGLEAVAKIVFRGRRGRRDDVSAGPVKRTRRYVVAVVPQKARSGRLTLIDRWGNDSTTSFRVGVRNAPRPKPLDLSPKPRYLYGGRRRPPYRAPGRARVELLSEASGEVIQAWDVQEPGELRWNGKGLDGVAVTGAYRFRASGPTIASAEEDSRFFFGDHLFPIRGRHDLGQSATNDFGGGRGHQGQDMFARCGTRIAAARGGKVQYAGFHSAAGYYVVIDASSTGIDHVYMHLRSPALVRTGQRVFTGQKIGDVGSTGRATGCHLHFEMWTAPGWYEGGRPFDPLPSLRGWDSYS